MGEVEYEVSEVLPNWRTQLRPPKEGSAAERVEEVVSAASTCPRRIGLSSLEGRFGRRRCRRRLRLSSLECVLAPEPCPRRLRPPKEEIRPPKVGEFRLWRGHSAAEPAAESVLSSLPLLVLHACFEVF